MAKKTSNIFFDITLSFVGGGEGMVRIELPSDFATEVLDSTQFILGENQARASHGPEGVSIAAREELERIVRAGFE